MKSILISIRPEWVAKIFKREKTREIRKTAPKEWVDYLSGKTKEKPKPMTGYIYCTKTIKPISDYDWGEFTFDDLPKLGKVIAKFTLREVERFSKIKMFDGSSAIEGPFKTIIKIFKKACLSAEELLAYCKMGENYAWHISDLQIFDESKELWEFGVMRAPQSWQYIVYPYGFAAGEKVKLVPQCAEYRGKEDKVYEVLGEPKCIGGSHCTPICYNGINQYFATEFLELASEQS